MKDLCLKQREEIKSLKNAILFPDVMNSQLQELLEKQGSELKQAKQLIPTLQRQVTSLTGQLQCLAEDVAEVYFLFPVEATSVNSFLMCILLMIYQLPNLVVEFWVLLNLRIYCMNLVIEWIYCLYYLQIEVA